MLFKKGVVAALGLAALLGTTVASSVNAATGDPPQHRVAPLPTPIGPVFHATPGQSMRIVNGQETKMTHAQAVALATPSQPVEIIEITPEAGPALPSSSPSASTPARSGVKQVAQTRLSYSGCFGVTYTVAGYNNLVYASIHQHWCWNAGFVSVWDKAYCWGDDNWPSYKYLGCIDPPPQEYGLYWNQGHTIWYASYCLWWQPWPISACWSKTTIYRKYTFNGDGTFWRYY